VEPQDCLKVHIQDLIESGCKINWVNAGAADASGMLPFVVSSRDDNSSFVPPLISAGLPQIRVPVKTLNEIVSAVSGPAPEIVKIDAEGFDLKVLAGASDLLGKTDVFFVEVTICCPKYENTIARVVRRMDEAGYHVVDITNLIRSPRYAVLWLCELVFLRNECPLFAGASTYK
jgi:FkbM family methyltransferase